MRAARVIAAASLILLAVACSSPARESTEPSPESARAAVDSATNRLLSALRTDSPDSLLALMPDDVILMPPHEPVLKGKAAVRAWYEAVVKQLSTTDLTITNRELLIGGDYATEVAEFEWTLVPVAGGAPMTDRGSYIQVWHKQPDGSWVFSREVWNSALPLGG